MTDLRTAAQQALEILERLHGGCTDSDDGTVEAITVWCPEIIEDLRAALAEPERKPLNEDQMNEAYINIWRNLPSDFGHTASEWVDVGIRYAERAHGIGEQK